MPLISLLPIGRLTCLLIEPQSLWEWEALGEMLFRFLKQHEASVSLVGRRSMHSGADSAIFFLRPDYMLVFH